MCLFVVLGQGGGRSVFGLRVCVCKSRNWIMVRDVLVCKGSKMDRKFPQIPQTQRVPNEGRKRGQN